MSFAAVKHLLSAVVLALLAGVPALAQTAQERRYCEGEDMASAGQRIEACSAVIKGGHDKGDKLAEVLASTLAGSTK